MINQYDYERENDAPGTKAASNFPREKNVLLNTNDTMQAVEAAGFHEHGDCSCQPKFSYKVEVEQGGHGCRPRYCGEVRVVCGEPPCRVEPKERDCCHCRCFFLNRCTPRLW